MLSVLVEAFNADGELLATWSHDGDDDELLALENEIATDVLAYFAPTAVATAVASTQQSESAHELVLRGTELEQQVRDDITVDEEKHQAAIDLYRRATLADPKSIEAHSRLAGALVYIGDSEAASSSLIAALDLVNSNVLTTSAELSDLYLTFALYLLQVERPGIEQWYRSAIQVNPNNADAQGAFAQWLMIHNQFAVAETYFAYALELDPERLSRYVDFAYYYTIGERMDRARELGDDIRERFPNARGDLALARLYENTGELDIGIAYGLRAYRAAPEDPDTFGQVAELYARIGLFNEAEAFDPDYELNRLYFRGEYPRLVDAAQEAMIDLPFQDKIRFMLAFAYNAVDDPQNAIFVLKTAGIPIEPGSEFLTSAIDEAMTTYIDALQAVDANSAEARELATKKAGALDPSLDRSWWVLSYHSCTQAQLGNLDESLTLFERIKESEGLAISPFLRDALCFRRLAANPRYEAVLDHLEERQAGFRAKLPATLQEYGVADVRPAR